MKVQRFEIGALLSTRLGGRDHGRQFIEALATTPPYSPKWFNTHEPVNRVFDRERVDEFLATWDSGSLWRRDEPAIAGQVVRGSRSAHDAIYISVREKAFDVAMTSALLEKLSRLFGVDFAYLHGHTDADDEDAAHYRTFVMPFAQGLNTYQLREGIPDMPWAVVFGPPYVELFGRERLLNVPAARVEAVNDGVYVQLTNDPADVAGKRDEYHAAQTAAKQHLDREAFRVEPSRIRYNVPRFDFGSAANRS